MKPEERPTFAQLKEQLSWVHMETLQPSKRLLRVLQDYEAKKANPISLKAGQIIELVKEGGSTLPGVFTIYYTRLVDSKSKSKGRRQGGRYPQTLC